MADASVSHGAGEGERGSDGPGAPSSDATTARLVQAAAEVFAEKGYDRAGVAEIARRAGLTTGAIYSRFSGKADLLAAALTAHLPDAFDLLFAENDGRKDVTDFFRIVGSHLVTERPSPMDGVLLEAFVAARRDPEVGAVLRRILDERRLLLTDLIGKAKAAGFIDDELDTTAIIHFAQAVGFGFLCYEAIGHEHPSASAWDLLLDTVVGSLSAAPPTAHAIDRSAPSHHLEDET